MNFKTRAILVAIGYFVLGVFCFFNKGYLLGCIFLFLTGFQVYRILAKKIKPSMVERMVHLTQVIKRENEYDNPELTVASEQDKKKSKKHLSKMAYNKTLKDIHQKNLQAIEEEFEINWEDEDDDL